MCTYACMYPTTRMTDTIGGSHKTDKTPAVPVSDAKEKPCFTHQPVVAYLAMAKPRKAPPSDSGEGCGTHLNLAWQSEWALCYFLLGLLRRFVGNPPNMSLIKSPNTLLGRKASRFHKFSTFNHRTDIF